MSLFKVRLPFDSILMISQFVPGRSGSCYVSLYRPSYTPSSWVLCFPAFAEEMNKSRAMMSAQAQALADAGVAVVVPDLFGTGDSMGDFAAADWGVWCADMNDLVHWIRRQEGGELYFWGIRLGCLLALDVAQMLEDPVAGLLFWQPQGSGQQAMTQFLRLRMAASVMNGGPQEKVADLRLKLEQGESLEVAGYELSSNLAKSIDGLTMQDLVPKNIPSVIWFEVSSSSDNPLSLVGRKIVGVWQQEGVNVDASVVEGEPFWMTQETSMAPALIQSTKDCFTCSTFTSDAALKPELAGLPSVAEYREQPLCFECEGEVLSAVLHHGTDNCKRGLIIVVGGPQYRVGSHRQFLLLARKLASEGIPVFRFDYRGMGDSSGSLVGFEGIPKDISAAADCFQRTLPQVEELVIWGLCDAATAAAFYAPGDDRVTGLVLLNPWVRSEQGEAKAYIKHYYIERLLSRGFWSKVIKGKFEFAGSMKSLRKIVSRAVGGKKPQIDPMGAESSGRQPDESLSQRMEGALSQFTGKTMLILSGNDLTAAEFVDATQKSKRFREMINRNSYTVVRLEEADHTFSRRAWRDFVAGKTIKWVKSW